MHAVIKSLVLTLLLTGTVWAQPQTSALSSKNGVPSQQAKKNSQQDDKAKQANKAKRDDKSKQKEAVQNAATRPPAVKAKVPPAPVPAKRIRELFQFVEQHHRALKPLLKTLERRHEVKFQVAMRTLDREVRSLQVQKKNSPGRYDRSLKIWVLRSQAKLVAAKIVTSKTDKAKAKLQKELESLVNQQLDLRQDQLQADLQAYQSRVDRLKKQQAELKSKRRVMVERQVDSLVRSLKGMTRNNKQNPKANKPKKAPPKTEPKKAKKSIGE